jgi:hypothetical protein
MSLGKRVALPVLACPPLPAAFAGGSLVGAASGAGEQPANHVVAPLIKTTVVARIMRRAQCNARASVSRANIAKIARFTPALDVRVDALRTSITLVGAGRATRLRFVDARAHPRRVERAALALRCPIRALRCAARGIDFITMNFSLGIG